MRTMRVPAARRILTSTPLRLATARRSFFWTRPEPTRSERLDGALIATFASGAAIGAGAGAAPARALIGDAEGARGPLPALSTARTVSVRSPGGSVIGALR